MHIFEKLLTKSWNPLFLGQFTQGRAVGRESGFESHLDHLLVVVEALAAVSTWGANNLFPIKLNYLTGIWSRESERLKTQ